MALWRVLKTGTDTAVHVFRVGETATDASGPVTVALKRLDGTGVAGAGTATTHPGPTGRYEYAVPAQVNLDNLTLDWTGTINTVAVTVRDQVEIVGGFLFDLAEARDAHRFIADKNKYPTELLAAKRAEVENEFERICNQAWVPRFARALVSGRGTDRVALPNTMIRTVRSVSIAGVAMSAPDVAALGFLDNGALIRPGGAIWPAGFHNIAVEYEHGWDAPPPELSEAGILRLRSRLGMTTSDIPDRAASFTVVEGGTYRLSTPGRRLTGIPDVDGILARPGYIRERRPAMA